MSDVFALTQEARRRVERNGDFCDRATGKIKPGIDSSDTELILLLVVAVILAESGANPILLLAIMYVIL